MRPRSKKTKTVDKNPQISKERRNIFDGIPLDLVIEIIGRLPLKSVARFLLVSKIWSKIIRSRHFVKSFPFGSSSSQPRVLITLSDLDRQREHQTRYLFSSSSSFLSRITCPFPNPEQIEYYSHYVNGLLSIGCGPEQFIVNPSTGKSIPLPRVRTRRRVVKSFFGYDSVNDEYKVLCMTEKMHGYPKKPSSQHQVFTLGAKRNLWEMIECRIPHRPWSNGVCIDGVVYYVAETGSGLSHMSLMRFDVRSNKLDLVTRVPEDLVSKVKYGYTFISNYEGKVAIPSQTISYTFDVWVMDQDAKKHEWLKRLSFSIEPWKDLFRYISIRGITQTGEFILVPLYFYGEVYVVHYNHKTESLRKIKVEVNAHYEFQRRPNFNLEVNGEHYVFRGTRATVFSDYVESVRLL